MGVSCSLLGREHWSLVVNGTIVTQKIWIHACIRRFGTNMSIEIHNTRFLECYFFLRCGSPTSAAVDGFASI